jgi:hypothetical protein
MKSILLGSAEDAFELALAPRETSTLLIAECRIAARRCHNPMLINTSAFESAMDAHAYFVNWIPQHGGQGEI